MDMYHIQCKHQVWSSVTRTIADFYSTQSNSNQIYNIIYFKTNTTHIHYEPFIMESNDHMYNAHSTKILVQQTKNVISIVKSKNKNLPYKVPIRMTHLILSFFSKNNAIEILALMMS